MVQGRHEPALDAGWQQLPPSPPAAPSAQGQPRQQQSAYFDAYVARSLGRQAVGNNPADGQARRAEPSHDTIARQATAAPAKRPAPEMPNPRPTNETRVAAILKSGVVDDGIGSMLYVDGSIEAELPQGHAALCLDQRIAQSPRKERLSTARLVACIPAGAAGARCGLRRPCGKSRRWRRLARYSHPINNITAKSLKSSLSFRRMFFLQQLKSDSKIQNRAQGFTFVLGRDKQIATGSNDIFRQLPSAVCRSGSRQSGATSMSDTTANGNYIVKRPTAEIVSANVSNNTEPAAEISGLINQVHAALSRVSAKSGEDPRRAAQAGGVGEKIYYARAHCSFQGRQEVQIAQATFAYPVQHDARTIPGQMGPQCRLSDGRAQLCGGALAIGQTNGARPAAPSPPALAATLPG